MCQPEVFDKLKAQLPKGIELKGLREVHGKHKALMAEADEARYRACLELTGPAAEALAAVRRYNEAAEVNYQRITPKKKRDIELKQYMLQPLTLRENGGQLEMELDIAITQSGSVKPSEVILVLAEQFGLPVNPAEAKITRTAMLSGGKGLLELV